MDTTPRASTDGTDGTDRVERSDLEQRVHVDLPRVAYADMVTTQPVQPARDPRGGRDTDTEFMLRHAGA